MNCYYIFLPGVPSNSRRVKRGYAHEQGRMSGKAQGSYSELQETRPRAKTIIL